MKISYLQIEKKSDFSTPSDMQGFFVYFKDDIGDVPSRVDYLNLINTLKNIADDECIVVEARPSDY